MKKNPRKKRTWNDCADVAYSHLLEELEKEILAARVKMSQAIEREKNLLFWSMGRKILKFRQGRDSARDFFNILARDLKDRVPKIEDFSEKGLENMERFYLSYQTIDYNPISMLPFDCHKMIINLIPDYQDRFDLADRALNNSWDLRKLLSKIRDRLPKWILLEWWDKRKWGSDSNK